MVWPSCHCLIPASRFSLQLIQIKEGGVADDMGRFRFSDEPCTRFSATKLSSGAFVVAYRAAQSEPTGPKMEAALIWGQHRSGELAFDPHPISMEPEQTEIWARSVALVGK